MHPNNSAGFGLGSTFGGGVSDAGSRTVSGQKKTFLTASVSCGELLWGVHVENPARFCQTNLTASATRNREQQIAVSLA